MVIKKGTSQRKTKIAAPPSNASYEELDEYFSKHSLDDLERAGLAKELSPAEHQWMNGITASVRSKVQARKSRSQLNLAFPEPDLARFMSYAERKHMPASTLARAWILERLDHESSLSK